MLNSTVTHEMMTPLSCVATFAERLATQIQDPRHRSYAKLIHRTSKLLKNYIRDLLDRSLIEKGKLILNLEVTLLRIVMNEIVEMMQYQAQMRGVVIELEVAEDITAYMLDVQRVTQIVLNLVSNAVKFSPEKGKIQVKVTQRHVLFKNALRISVTDSGIGISPEQQAQLFKPFSTV